MSFMTPPMRLCLAALAVESLVRDGLIWRLKGRRGFSHETVAALIRRGLAKRLGNRIIGVLAANDNGPECR
jgi:hypothetical protein